ncbi:tetratricopeptide repeat protein [Methylocystis parvus]|uniref:Tetratricopeptide repeat protein n=1 Tax=Methylocystis parvus TaxID=134 RepID=A0A6B8M3F7_9HYPH|nr:tetratricopeptide repeat protein [Methylocystis parvus]QGM96662.1 hypothetical protein F7D14_03630 [Methylocystis parvus]WBJ99477.1 tetratricopeptide repeat protein [Methylocystis parvus OBBP]
MRRVGRSLRCVSLLVVASILSCRAVAEPSTEGALEKAREFIRAKHYAQAVSLLEQSLAGGSSIPPAEILELFGEALAKAGRYQQARLAMQDYMRFYPKGDGAARVKMRLGALPPETAPPPMLATKSASNPGDTTNPDDVAWSMNGSLSSYFIRDDSYNAVKDISIAPNPSADPDAHRLHQNTFLTTFDQLIFIKHPYAKTKIKISGMDEHRMRPGEVVSDQYGLSQAYVETVFDALDLSVRIGRQTRNAGGVLGRFDGALVSWRMSQMLRLNAVAGSANISRFDAPLKDGRFFAGGSVDLRLTPNLDVSLFAIQQNMRTLLDRRAVGGEFRYFNKNLSVLGMVDYDIHFNRFNAGTISSSYTFEDGSVVAGSFDRRRVPYLASFNALQGQPFLTLYDMLKFRSQDEVRRFAIDRTPYFQSAMMSYTRPLTDKLSINFDATTTYVSGTLPSGGVDGSKPLGREYYVSGQLIANDIFAPGDLYTGALRFARLADSYVYFIDLDARFPLTEQFRVSPRLRLGYREDRNAPLQETTILPSLLLDYFVTRNLAIEAELATKWIDTAAGNFRGQTRDLFFTLGVRSDFGSDGIAHCVGRLTPCLASMFGATHAEGKAAGERPAAAAPALSSAYLFEVGARYWLGGARTAYDYFASDTPTLKVSSLSYDRLVAQSGELFFRGDAREGLLRNVFLKGNIDAGVLQSGRLLDHDYPIGDLGSLTRSAASGRTVSATIDLGYNIYTGERMRVGAFVGWQSWFDAIDAKGCEQIGLGAVCFPPISNTFRMASERDHFKSFRVGAALDVALTDKLSWSGEFALASTYLRATDTHYFTFGADPAKGRGGGFEAETAMKYAFTDRMSLGVGLKWRHLSADALDMYGQLLKYEVNRIGLFAQASYRFGWGDLLKRD